MSRAEDVSLSLPHQLLVEALSAPDVLPASVPALGSLWEQLLVKLHSAQQEQATQQALLSRARARYLSQALLLQQITRVANCSVSNSNGNSNAQPQGPALAELARRVQVANAVQRLELPGSGASPPQAPSSAGAATDNAAMPGAAAKAGSHSHWYGVTPQDLLSTCQLTPTATQEVQQATVPLVEEALLARHYNLRTALQAGPAPALPDAPSPSRFNSLTTATPAAGGGGRGGDDQDGVAGAGPLTCGARAAQRVAAVGERRACVMLALHQQQRLSARLLDGLLRVSSKLQGFSEREVAQWQQQQSQFAADLAGEHTRSLCHKVSHVETQVLSHMYTPADCSALAKVHGQLAARSDELDRQLHQVRSQVIAYEALGPSFQVLVSTYGRLRAELRAAQQALSTFTELESELEMRDA